MFMCLKTNRFIFTLGTGAWESALTNTLSPGDRIVSFLIGQFSLLWIDQQQRLNFNVDVVESEWGRGANLEILASKLAADTAHTIKAICIVHNETATGVTNNLTTVRKLLGKVETLWYISTSPFSLPQQNVSLIKFSNSQMIITIQHCFLLMECLRYVLLIFVWTNGA